MVIAVPSIEHQSHLQLQHLHLIVLTIGLHPKTHVHNVHQHKGTVQKCCRPSCFNGTTAGHGGSAG